ncbi:MULTISPECIES: J domain-containing protein [Sphingomonadales]|uniref:DnaJ domain protein n=1 Tax=Edaphosphingomonas haloaromaticamans TaxID=653954 RepID=A0A1S1HGD5_9SPHN|nr:MULTISPECIES: J domain-containing protein [Sphingomonas]AGH48867.1 heat shock protein DnaJ domain-containing protein [Sphingomonas sp. MM-1]MDX3885038.1 J domain-containing protein [Sphingomonas sp.]OHT21294.1 DnaJ domain protein [Sphingomonas haloaromaticamans]
MADGGEQRRRQDRFHGRIGTGDRPCAHPGCMEPGEFRVPGITRPGFDGPGEWRWMCLDHVRAFNAGYNFFDGMTADEIENAQRPFAGWERETRAFSTSAAGAGPRWADFVDPLDAIGARYAEARAARPDGRPLGEGDRRALQVLGLKADADLKAIRKRYTELVRRYHPDRNGGDRRHEKALQDVISAYTHLKAAPAFA